jgi:hypothetical protein
MCPQARAITKYIPKVDMHYMTSRCQHDVSIVPVFDLQQIGYDTVASK